MMVGGSQQETLDPGLVLLGTRQQGLPVILRDQVLPDGFDRVSPSFTVIDYLLDYQLAAASESVGLNIHKGKSKVLKYNTVSTNPLTLDGEALEDVESFTHLVSIIDEQEGSDADVKAKIGKARAAFLLLKNIWNSKQLLTNIEI
ncbi:unnamed protein product [Schistosoma curassoni]|uniref:Reverse transcriptase domain-containing protein n=1 Tax=Schistosoma curassoni TaxID=6186 RepID=A0A183K0B3_9TREM|nr:unnamed protein product [Schistosoma curassoni]